MSHRNTVQRLSGCALVLVVGLAACGETSGVAPQVTERAAPPPRVDVQSQKGTFDVRFTLRERTLAVSIGARTPRKIRRELRAQPLALFCGRAEEFGPYGASALARARFPQRKNVLRVQLSSNIAGSAAFCGIEGERTGDISFVGFFGPERSATGS